MIGSNPSLSLGIVLLGGNCSLPSSRPARIRGQQELRTHPHRKKKELFVTSKSSMPQKFNICGQALENSANLNIEPSSNTRLPQPRVPLMSRGAYSVGFCLKHHQRSRLLGGSREAWRVSPGESGYRMGNESSKSIQSNNPLSNSLTHARTE